MRLNIIFIILATISMVSAQGGGGGGGNQNVQAGQAGQTVQPVQSGQTVQLGQYPSQQVDGQTNPQNGGQSSIPANNPQNQPSISNQIKQGGGGPNAAVGAAIGGVGAAVTGGVNSVTGSVNSAATNFGLFIDSLPKCFKKCTQESSTTVGCSGMTDINCICSNPQFINSVLSCASLDKECSQNQFSIQQGQSAITNFCQNYTQSEGATVINSTFSSSSGRSRWPVTNDAAASSQNVLAIGTIVLTAFLTCAAVFL